MNVTLNLRKSLEENASDYFEAAKKAKRKLKGAEQALEISKARLLLLQEKDATATKTTKDKVIREKHWYEKFRWFISSEGFLCVGGRDATTNEIVIKKHTDKGDIVFHTQMSGSPFFVIKADGKEIGKQTFEETADAVVSFSRAWKLGLSNAEVFYVKPDQLTKTAKAGEYVERGSFIVNGKVTTMLAEVKLAVGMTKDNLVMCGPTTSVKKNCGQYIGISQGKEKSSSVAKYIKKKIGGEIDDIIRVLPSGGVKID